jgi:Flp pilus assembly pilin Flp
VFVNGFFKTEVGQDVIEYALLCALMASIGAGLAVSIGLNIDTAYNTIDSKHKQARPPAAAGLNKTVTWRDIGML